MTNLDRETVARCAQSGDLLLFRGQAWYSRWIEYFTGSQYSHVALLIRDPEFGSREQLPGLYVFESTLFEIPEVESGCRRRGVQLVRFEDVCEQRKQAGETICYRRLDCVRDRDFSQKLRQIHEDVHAQPYDLHWTHWVRAKFDIELGQCQDSSSFWCSAFVGYVYVRLGLLHPQIPWTLLTPRRFSSLEDKQLSFLHCTLSDDQEIRL